MINLLLYCEGSSDRGYEEYIDGEYVFPNGVMQVLIKKLSQRNDIVFIVVKRQDFMRIPVRKGFLGKSGITSRRLALLAKEKKCTHIAFHRDEDNKGFKNKYNEVHHYFADAVKSGIQCIAIVPQHMTENWLLADKSAWKAVYDAFPTKPPLPAKPEELWGAKNTENHPKKYMEQVFTQFHAASSPESYAEIAEASNTETLRAQCPISFGQFYTDMQNFTNEAAS
jgi:hypothetical protein